MQETLSRPSGSLSLSDHKGIGVISTNMEPYINDHLVFDEDKEWKVQEAALNRKAKKMVLC